MTERTDKAHLRDDGTGMLSMEQSMEAQVPRYVEKSLIPRRQPERNSRLLTVSPLREQGTIRMPFV
jgi:hypothetical protein